MNQITVNGNTYSSVAAAWRELSPPDLPIVTVRWRLRTGWVPDDAFSLPQVDPQVRRRFKKIREDAANV